MGCCPVAAFGAAYPDRVLSIILFWPVGGARYRINTHRRFAEHLAFVQERGLAEVVALAKSSGKTFGQEPRGGPWASVIRNDAAFAEAFAAQDAERYRLLVTGMARTLFDRDSAPGAEPEDVLRLDIPALVVPGQDAAHAPSAARYLHECLPRSEYWDVAVPGQTEDATNARVLDFLGRATSA
jgi:pimeloyl-ACP methyl ester carboxylesterase